MTRERWSDVYEMAILEFLNILAYRRDKREEERKQQEAWKLTH